MDSNLMWLSVIVLVAIGAMIAQFVVNRRNKRHPKQAQ